MSFYRHALCAMRHAASSSIQYPVSSIGFFYDL
jgi:hypothetical protein